MPGRRTAGSPRSQVAAARRRTAARPGRRTAGSPHSRVAAQPGRRAAGSPHSRVAAQPGRRTAGAAAQALLFLILRNGRNVFLLFLPKSTFLFLGTCSCTLPACSQKVEAKRFERIYKLSVKIHVKPIEICGVFCSQKVEANGAMEMRDFMDYILIYI